MAQPTSSMPQVRPPALPHFRTPGGGLITIDAPGYNLGRGWFGYFQVTVQRPYAGVPSGLQVREPAVAPLGTVDFLVKHVVRGRVVDELHGQGGRFLLARSDLPDGQGLFAWQGRWHEIYSWLPAPSMSAADALRYLEGLGFEDSPLGLRVIPREIPTEVIVAEEVSKAIPGVGILDIMRRDSANYLLPRWVGARTHAGEVWRKPMKRTSNETSDQVLILATETTVVQIHPESIGADSRLKFLDQLVSLTWSL